MRMINARHLITTIALAIAIGPASMGAGTTDTPSNVDDQRRKTDAFCFAVFEAGVRKSEIFMSGLINFRDMRAAIKRHYRDDTDFFEEARYIYAEVIGAFDTIEAKGGTMKDKIIGATEFTNICLAHYNNTYDVN